MFTSKKNYYKFIYQSDSTQPDGKHEKNPRVVVSRKKFELGTN